MRFFGFIIYVIFCFVAASAAKKRGRSSIGYFILSIILSPLLGIIIVLVLGETEELRKNKELRNSQIVNVNLNIPLNGERDNARITTPNENFNYLNTNENKPILPQSGQYTINNSVNNEQKKCPFCAEYIKKEAIICRFCGKDQPNEKEKQPNTYIADTSVISENKNSEIEQLEKLFDATSDEYQKGIIAKRLYDLGKLYYWRFIPREKDSK